MKNFARKFIVGNSILNKCFTTRGKKTVRIQFLVNKLKSMHFYEKFCYDIFCRKLNFEQICHHQGLGKNISNSVFSLYILKLFLAENRKLNFEQMFNQQGSGKFCIFMKNFAGKFFVANRIWHKCVTRSRKKSFDFSFW